MANWFDTDGFVPHGFCLSWDATLMNSFLLANAMIAFAYLAITMVLVIRALEPAPAVPRWLYWSYAGFIFCCGISHVLDDVTLWFPVYRLQVIVLAMTAGASIVAAILPVSIWMQREAERWRK